MISIHKSLRSGIFYISAAKYSGVFISIILSAVLARLLTPEEFGIVALVLVFVSFFNLLSDFGLGPAIVQNQSLEEEDVKSIFLFSILLGFILSSLFFLAAPLISNFYNEPALLQISKYLALAVLFQSLQVIPKALFQKALKFKLIGIITVGVQLFCGIIAIYLAYAGYSYYALVVQSVLVGGITFVIFYLLKPIKIARKMQFSAIKKIIRFSTFQFLFNFINYFSRNADNILVGKFLGASTLGYYEKSYRLMMMPVQNLTHVITPVLMPVLSKYQNDRATIYGTYLKVVKLLATIGFPLSIFLFFTASEVINIIYGSQWEQSIPVFKLLALTVGLQIISSSSGSIFQAVNRTDLLFYSGILSALFMVGAISYGVFVRQSLEAVGYGLIVAFSVNFLQGFFMLINVALKKSFLTFLRVFLFPLFVSGIIGGILWIFESVEIDSFWYSFLIKANIAFFSFIVVVLLKKENRVYFQRLRKMQK